MNRELGFSQAGPKMQKALGQKTANHLINDSYHSEIIELPKNSYHRITRCQDLAAILSIDKSDRKIQRLALYSLITKSKLWELEVLQAHEADHLSNFILSAQGLVLVAVPSTKQTRIIWNGKQSGMLPETDWKWIMPIGMRILGCFAEKKHNITNHFYSEWDQEGNRLSSYKLDYTQGRWTHTCVCDENFWVRLSGSKQADLASIIEIVDRTLGKIRTFALPLNADEERFSSAHIVQNQLFYSKSSIRSKEFYNPTVCIFDLLKGATVEEFPTGAEMGELKNLSATEDYAAWLEYRGNKDDRVRYLNVLNKTIQDVTNVPYCLDNPNVNLDITGTALSITYAGVSWNYGGARWHRKVIDMTNGQLKSEVNYKRLPAGLCSIVNGNLLITEQFSDAPQMHIESFFGEGAKSSFRS